MTAAPGAVAAAVLLPPLGVHLGGGGVRAVQTACGLTALGFVPGVAYALYTLLRPPAVTNPG